MRRVRGGATPPPAPDIPCTPLVGLAIVSNYDPDVNVWRVTVEDNPNPDSADIVTWQAFISDDFGTTWSLDDSETTPETDLAGREWDYAPSGDRLLKIVINGPPGTFFCNAPAESNVVTIGTP